MIVEEVYSDSRGAPHLCSLAGVVRVRHLTLKPGVLQWAGSGGSSRRTSLTSCGPDPTVVSANKPGVVSVNKPIHRSAAHHTEDKERVNKRTSDLSSMLKILRGPPPPNSPAWDVWESSQRPVAGFPSFKGKLFATGETGLDPR